MQCQQETLLLHSLPHVVVTTKLDVGSSVELLVQPMDINFEDVCEESFSQVNLWVLFLDMMRALMGC